MLRATLGASDLMTLPIYTKAFPWVNHHQTAFWYFYILPKSSVSLTENTGCWSWREKTNRGNSFCHCLFGHSHCSFPVPASAHLPLTLVLPKDQLWFTAARLVCRDIMILSHIRVIWHALPGCLLFAGCASPDPKETLPHYCLPHQKMEHTFPQQPYKNKDSDNGAPCVSSW